MKKAVLILLSAGLVFLTGINIAYYNTSILLKDSANIISFSDDSLNIYEYNILYSDIKEKIELIEKAFKTRFITIYISKPHYIININISCAVFDRTRQMLGL